MTRSYSLSKRIVTAIQHQRDVVVRPASRRSARASSFFPYLAHLVLSLPLLPPFRPPARSPQFPFLSAFLFGWLVRLAVVGDYTRTHAIPRIREWCSQECHPPLPAIPGLLLLDNSARACVACLWRSSNTTFLARPATHLSLLATVACSLRIDQLALLPRDLAAAAAGAAPSSAADTRSAHRRLTPAADRLWDALPPASHVRSTSSSVRRCWRELAGHTEGEQETLPHCMERPHHACLTGTLSNYFGYVEEWREAIRA